MTFTQRCLVKTNLPIDHVAHGDPDLHASSLDMVEIEMMKDSQGNGCHRDACSVDVGLRDCSCVGGIIVLKELNYFPE